MERRPCWRFDLVKLSVLLLACVVPATIGVRDFDPASWQNSGGPTAMGRSTMAMERRASAAHAINLPTGMGQDQPMALPKWYFNPSVVMYKGQYVAGARTAYMSKMSDRRWLWHNEAFVCTSTVASFSALPKQHGSTNIDGAGSQAPLCQPLDPHGSSFKECMWTGLVETQGPEDAKLFVWPGRGVYVIFGRKPELAGAAAGQLCSKQAPVFQQFMWQLIADPGYTGAWRLAQPMPLRVEIPGFYLYDIDGQKALKEKNWMPFVHNKHELYAVHSVQPQHRVLKLESTGAVYQQHVTDSGAVLGARFSNVTMHGGPPVVYVPAELSPTGKAHYLGVLHYYDWHKSAARDLKVYRHFWYRFDAQPPFRMCAVSQELPLVFTPSPRRSRRTNSRLLQTGGAAGAQPATLKPAGGGAAGPERAAAGGAGSGGAAPGALSVAPPASEAFKSQRIWRDGSQTAYVSGLYMHPDNGTLVLSYGSGDIMSRVKLVTQFEVEALFTGVTHAC